MGGGQANSGQASTAASQQTAANNQDMALSKQYGGQEQAIFSKLFGPNASGGGTLSGMMDPKSLNTGAPEGAYKTAWNNSQNNIAQSYAGQRGQLAQQFANSGATSNSTPNGFQADQMGKLRRGEADTRGDTYTGVVGQQHQDALNNFWNANNIAAGQQAQATGGSTAGAGNAGSSSAAIYGTAGQYHPSQGLQVAGQLGSAAISNAKMCPATGQVILMADRSWKAVEHLHRGDKVMGIDGEPDELIDDPYPTHFQEVIDIKTHEHSCVVSLNHTFARGSGGYVFAAKSVSTVVSTITGKQTISEGGTHAEKAVCWQLFLNRSHTYCVGGLWSLE